MWEKKPAFYSKLLFSFVVKVLSVEEEVLSARVWNKRQRKQIQKPVLVSISSKRVNNNICLPKKITLFALNKQYNTLWLRSLFLSPLFKTSWIRLNVKNTKHFYKKLLKCYRMGSSHSSSSSTTTPGCPSTQSATSCPTSSRNVKKSSSHHSDQIDEVNWFKKKLFFSFPNVSL